MADQSGVDVSSQDEITDVEHLLLLFKHIGSLHENENYSDVTFNIQGETIRAHKLILATRTEYFNALLFGGFKEKDLDVVDLGSDTPLNGFRQILRYIYTGRMRFSDQTEDDTLEVLSLSHKYGMAELGESVQDYIVKHILSYDTISKIISFNELYNYKKLYDACGDLINKNPSKFVENKDFVNMSAQSVHAIVSRDSFSMVETDIFLAAKKWCDANSNASMKERDLVMSCVRLQDISREYLLDDVWATKLISDYTILKAIHDQDKNKLHDVRLGTPFNENVATPKLGAKVINGAVSLGKLAENLLSGKTDSNTTGFTYHVANDNTGIVIELDKVRYVNHVRILTYTHFSYYYSVDISTNKTDWKKVAEANTSNQTGVWNEHRFDNICTKYIRIKGSCVTNAGYAFCIVSLEAYFRPGSYII